MRTSCLVINVLVLVNPNQIVHEFLFCSWFTDNGIFLSSGRDGKLKVWDTNAGSVVEEFNSKFRHKYLFKGHVFLRL